MPLLITALAVIFFGLDQFDGERMGKRLVGKRWVKPIGSDCRLNINFAIFGLTAFS